MASLNLKIIKDYIDRKASSASLGKSAYEVAVDNGFVGNEKQWLESLKGTSGQDGKNGVDGYSPTTSVIKSGKTATITITDMSGTTTATVSDGQDGEDWIPTAAEKSAIAAEAAGLIDISGKADKATTYTKTEVDTKLSNKANSADVYTKTQSDGKYLTAHQDISGKADKASTLAGYGISDGETTLHKVTSITADANDTQYPSALAVKKAIDATNPYVFVTKIPEDSDHNKKYVLPDGYIWEWQESTSSIPYNANTKIINKRPPTSDSYEAALLNQSGTLVSELIPFDASWKYSNDGSYGHLADIQISGINKLVPAYNSSVIVYYYRRDNGNSLGAALSAQMYTLNYTPNTNDITLPVQFSLMDQNVYFSGLDTANPGATIGYVRVMVGISTGSNITENDVKDVVINVPFYDTPGTEAGWVSTGEKHPDYISDGIFDVDTDQVLYVVGDSIAYGYGGSGGAKVDSWVKYVIEHNGYDAEKSVNLSESGLGFCTTSTKSHTINNIVGDTDFSSADVVVVALGINDWKSSATLAQLWTGMQYCFNKIRTDNPYCKIYYLLPFNVSYMLNNHPEYYETYFKSFFGLGFKGDSDATKCYGNTLREFINLIKAKCSESDFKAYDIRLIDMVECAAINRNNITTALFDNLHPSAATQEKLGKEIARHLAQDCFT